jgi:hypothetical protein
LRQLLELLRVQPNLCPALTATDCREIDKNGLNCRRSPDNSARKLAAA